MDSSNMGSDVVRSPGDFIRDELKVRDWTQADLARVLGRPLPTLNRILQGKHAILPEMAIALGAAFGDGAEIWMERESAYRLSLAARSDDHVQRRARIYDLAPIAELERRGWITQLDDPEQLEREVCRLLEIRSIHEEPTLLGALRKTNPHLDITNAQRAWWFRIRQIAGAMTVSKFDPDSIENCATKLRKLAAFPQEAHKAVGLLAEYGIRLVIVEPLAGVKADGVAMWLDESSPVIGMSLHRDRVDSFWFTLGHEFSHIRHHDEVSFDSDLSGRDIEQLSIRVGMERRADAEAAALLIDPEVISSFIKRVAPMYSKKRIIQFANRIKIHPGIIVGQLQHRGEIGWNANREMLVKVRHVVTPVAITDGWGYSFSAKCLSENGHATNFDEPD